MYIRAVALSSCGIFELHSFLSQIGETLLQVPSLFADSISENHPRVIDDVRARKLASDLKKCAYYETCATYGLNVERVFQDGECRTLDDLRSFPETALQPPPLLPSLPASLSPLASGVFCNTLAVPSVVNGRRTDRRSAIKFGHSIVMERQLQFLHHH